MPPNDRVGHEDSIPVTFRALGAFPGNSGSKKMHGAATVPISFPLLH